MGIHSGRNGNMVGLPECGGKVGSPCSPAEAGACRTWIEMGLAAQPAQNVSGLNVLSTLDVLADVENASLELRFERQRRRSRQTMRQLAEHGVQLSAPLITEFAAEQSTFRLKVPHGTPPL